MTSRSIDGVTSRLLLYNNGIYLYTSVLEMRLLYNNGIYLYISGMYSTILKYTGRSRGTNAESSLGERNRYRINTEYYTVG